MEYGGRREFNCVKACVTNVEFSVGVMLLFSIFFLILLSQIQILLNKLRTIQFLLCNDLSVYIDSLLAD